MRRHFQLLWPETLNSFEFTSTCRDPVASSENDVCSFNSVFYLHLIIHVTMKGEVCNFIKGSPLNSVFRIESPLILASRCTSANNGIKDIGTTVLGKKI